eukprot:scaffold1087_cov198-Pinguiococcus_pyrenoidosus.AAC.9
MLQNAGGNVLLVVSGVDTSDGELANTSFVDSLVWEGAQNAVGEIHTQRRAERRERAGHQPGGKVQAAKALFRVVHRGTDAHEHQCLGIRAERILQEMGQHRVAERHVVALLRPRGDDVAQGGQRLVDVLRLLECLASRS